VTLLTLLNTELAYGLTPLLDAAACSLNEGDRIGLIGRNGTGKSTLLGVMAGRVALDDAEESGGGEAAMVCICMPLPEAVATRRVQPRKIAPMRASPKSTGLGMRTA